MSSSSIKTAAAGLSSSLSSSPAAAGLAPPDGRAARNAKGHFTQPFKLLAVRYAVACDKSQRLAAADMGLSENTLSTWIRDAQPDSTGVVDADRFDELATLRTKVREQDALLKRVCMERDFLKKAAAYFATPTSPIGGSK